jgi:hypothetical protein
MASLTKEELKTALINHGISPPPANSRKDEFLALYEEHVKPVDEEAGEFSSDDEVTISPRKKTSQSSAKSTASSKSPKKGKKKIIEASTEESSLMVGDLDLDQIEDDELFRLLKENGIEVGPIVASTRPFYKKKLSLVLRGENGMGNGTNGEFSDTEPETEPEDEQPSGVTSPQVRVSTRGRSSASSSNKSPVSTPVENGLRKRMNLGGDEIDSSLRNSPTPRRSIHTYKVTETTRQTIVKSSDGEETRDTVRTLEKSESKADTGAKPSFFSTKKILLLLLVLILLAVLLYSYSNQKLSVDNIMESVQKTVGGAKNKPTAPPPAVPAPAATPPQPDQSSIGDV